MRQVLIFGEPPRMGFGRRGKPEAFRSSRAFSQQRRLANQARRVFRFRKAQPETRGGLRRQGEAHRALLGQSMKMPARKADRGGIAVVLFSGANRAVRGSRTVSSSRFLIWAMPLAAGPPYQLSARQTMPGRRGCRMQREGKAPPLCQRQGGSHGDASGRGCPAVMARLP